MNITRLRRLTIASIGGVLLISGAARAVSTHNIGRTRQLLKFLWLLVLVPVLMAQPAQAAPIIANWADSNPSLVYGANSVSQTVGGITITAQGYTIEFDGSSSRILGPFPTSLGFANLQVFGTATSGLPGQSGLGLLSQPLPGIPATGRDFGGGNYRPGIDDFPYPSSLLPKDEFVLFSFSSPVDVQAVVVDAVSNFSRKIWAAGGTSAPNLNADFLSAFSGYTVVNSLDDTGDGLFTHILNFPAVLYLAVGAPIPASVGPLGPFQPIGGSQFYVVGLDVNTTVSPAPTPVPGPSTLLLVGIPLVGLLAARWTGKKCLLPIPRFRGSRYGCSWERAGTEANHYEPGSASLTERKVTVMRSSMRSRLNEKRQSAIALIVCASMVCGSPAGRAIASEQEVDIKAAAQEGDPDALFTLAVMYELGRAVAKDPAEAARLFQKAAHVGHAASKVQLGLLYQTGTGVPRDVVRARTFFADAAQAGDIEGQFRLAMTFVYGLGTEKDPVMARRWLASAATGGHQEAQMMLGIMMQAGTGGPKNEFSARRWLRQAGSGRDATIAQQANGLAEKIDQRVLFSGPFRPEEAAALLAVSVGIALLIGAGNSDGLSSQANLGNDPSDPFNYKRLSTNTRKERCFQVMKFGPSITLNGRLAIMSSPQTMTQCVSY